MHEARRHAQQNVIAIDQVMFPGGADMENEQARDKIGQQAMQPAECMADVSFVFEVR